MVRTVSGSAAKLKWKLKKQKIVLAIFRFYFMQTTRRRKITLKNKEATGGVG